MIMELNNDELLCVARHLVAQQRQTVFKRTASIIEACEKCPINSKCYKDSDSRLWGKTYKKICEETGLKGFCYD